ncbi:hypothetical protein HY641_04960 [Candidatus Woesearchaeota archaeon]|nr:hypothetical protein [Candidatus Woesearchaeota archaeon]
MQRKAIQLAKNTLVISLPASWVKRQGVRKGSELHIKEDGAELRISQVAYAHRTANVDISGLSERMIRWTISGLHKIGADEMLVRYQSQDQVRIVEDLIRDTLLGFAIISQAKGVVTIRQVAKDANDQFDAVFRRALLVTVSLAEGVANAIKRRDWDELRSVALLERSNNQLTNFCIRLIHRGESQSPIPSMHTMILWNVEKLADEYKYLIQSLPKEPRVTPRCQDLLCATAVLVRSYYNAVYAQGFDDMDAVSRMRKDVERKGVDLLQCRGDAEVAHAMINIARRVGDATSALVALRSCQGLGSGEKE